MTNRRFIYCWFSAVIVMFSLSYFWHGIILNDFDRINISKTLFILMMGLAYIGIGFLLTFINQISFMDKSPYKKGFFLGILLGFLVFLISFVLGLSFINSPSINYIIVDAVWQMIEQSFGGLTICYVNIYLIELQKRLAQ